MEIFFVFIILIAAGILGRKPGIKVKDAIVDLEHEVIDEVKEVKHELITKKT